MVTIPNWIKSKKTLGGAAAAGLIGLGLWKGDNIENYLSGKSSVSQPAPIVQTVKKNSKLEFEDGPNGSLTIKPSFGNDWAGDAYKITKDGEDLSKTFSTQRTSVQDTEVEDGTKYDYTLHGIDSNTGKLTGSRLSGDFTPYDDAFDYQFKLNAEDVRFDNKGNVQIVPSFEEKTKGNKVNFANFALVNSQGDTLDTELFSDLNKAEEGFKLNGGNYTGDAQVLGELRLARGNNVVASDSTEVLDDMPQFVAGTLDQNRHLQGYKMSVTDFQDKAEADSLWNKLKEDPSLAKYRSMFVNPDISVTDPDDLVGKVWVNPDGTPVSYKEAFSVKKPIAKEPVAVEKLVAEKPDWKENLHYRIIDDVPHGTIDGFVVLKGNTVSGALETVATHAQFHFPNAKEFDITAYDAKTRELTVEGYDDKFSLDDLVIVNRGNHNLGKFDPLKIQPGDRIELSKSFYDLMYGTEEVAPEVEIPPAAPEEEKTGTYEELSQRIEELKGNLRVAQSQVADWYNSWYEADDQLEAKAPRVGVNYNYTLESEAYSPEFSLDFPLDNNGNWRLGAVFSPESTGTQDWGAYRDVDITRQSAGVTLSKALTENFRLGAGLEYTSERKDGLNLEKYANPYRLSIRPEIELSDKFSLTGNLRSTGFKRSFTRDFGDFDNYKANADYGLGLKLRF